MSKITCTIGIDGTDNIRILNDYVGARCYRIIREHNRNIGQIEPALEDLVCVNWVPANKVNKVLDTLRKIGVSGAVSIETDGVDDDYFGEVYIGDGTKATYDAIYTIL